MLEVAVRPVPSTDHGRTVAEYWALGFGWRWEDFETFLPQDILNYIQAIQIYPDEGIQDALYWGKTSLGLFSLQSAMDIVRDDNPCSEQVRHSDV